ncbi:MAG TPA: GAF domain-containing protein, partial [Solirubrobacteraceae bacterium]|nr:GAF domain-containing protein [Solirubrobacteraceae bacterium]
MAERTAEVHAANDEVDALRRVATLVAQGVASVEFFSAVSDEVGRLFGSDISAIVRFERDGTAALMGVHGGPHALGARVELEPGYVVASVRRGARAARFDTDDPEAVGMPQVVRTLGIRSGVASPIVVDGELWGAITLASLGRLLPPGTERQLAGFTELIATALANAQARDALSRLADEQAALRRVATLVARGVSPDELFAAVSNEVATLFGAEIATIGRFELTEPPVITAVGVSEGPHDFLIGLRSPLMDWLASTTVYRTGRTARREITAEQVTDPGTLSDAIRAMGFFSTVSAPIVVEGELWGVVTASSSEESLPADTERRIESFSELVATAIANAQSRGELATSEARARALAEEQAALRRVATLVAGAPLSEELFSTVAREVATVLNVPGVLVQRFETDGAVVTFGVAYNSDL